MADGIITEGLGLIMLALAVPAATEVTSSEHYAVAAVDFDLATHAVDRPRSLRKSVPRNERAGLASQQEFAQSEDWVPPAKRWGESEAGPVVELGALGAEHAWQPDLIHVSLDWHF